MNKEHQGQSLNALNEQTPNLMPSMNVFCSVHKGLRVEYVSVDPAQEFVFKCVNCISEENVPQSTLIPINLILTSDVKTIFANFPITDRSLAMELRTLAQAPTTSEQVILKIQSFFKEFRVNLLHKLEIIEKKMTEKAKSISDFGSIIEQYNKICAKKELKLIVNDNEKELQVKSAEIKTICQKILSKEQEHNSSIRTALERLKTLKSAINFETPDLIKESIFSQIDKIDMFLVDDFKQFEELVDRKAHDKNQNIQNLMELISNKLNGISIESCQRLNDDLNKVSFTFSAVKIPEIGAIGKQLELLNESSQKVIEKLVEDLAKNQQAKEMDEDRENKENLNARDLVKLISNKTNFCSNFYIEDIAQVMNILERLLELFLVRKPKIKVEQQNAFNSLSEKKLFNFAQLAIITNRIIERHTDSYLNSSTPQAQIQPNSNIIRRIIQRMKGFDQLSNENSNLIESLDKILVNYPIFELLPPSLYKLLFIPVPIEFIKTNHYEGQQIQITQKGELIQFRLDPSKCGQVVSEILDNSLGYLLKVKFSKPLAVAKEGFLIGLIPNSKIHSNIVLYNSYESGFINDPRYGAKIILKGGKLTSEELMKVTDCIEFRFCISNHLFLFSDASYSNINQAESKHFNALEKYRFAIFLNGNNNRPSDMLVSVSEFGIINLKEVKNFQ